MEEYRVRRVLRHMEWQRAKGSLLAILGTFWDEREAFEEINEVFETFIKNVEDGGIVS